MWHLEYDKIEISNQHGEDNIPAGTHNLLIKYIPGIFDTYSIIWDYLSASPQHTPSKYLSFHEETRSLFLLHFLYSDFNLCFSYGIIWLCPISLLSYKLVDRFRGFYYIYIKNLGKRLQTKLLLHQWCYVFPITLQGTEKIC